MKRLTMLMALLPILMITSCGLLKSGTRSVKLQVKNYETLLSNSDWAKANKMCDDKFVWIKGGKKYKGRRPAKAFHKTLAAIHNHDSMIIDIRSVKEMSGGKFLVTGFMQMRQAGSTSIRSVKWDMSMTWIKTKNGWKILEINELAERVNFSS